jgi:hypothetical protein
MATWLVATSTVVAPVLGANCRWASGGIAWSPASRIQDGSDFQGRDAHHLLEGAPVQRLLDREHDRGLDRINISRELVDEVVFGDSGKPCWSTSRSARAGPGGPWAGRGADRLTLISRNPAM